MKISLFADVGLRILMVLQRVGDERLTSPELASATGTPQSHVSKVVTQLRHHGWLDVERGRAGGSTLTAAGLSVSVGDVLRALDTRPDVAECRAGDEHECPLLPGCQLRHQLDRAREAFYAVLDEVSVAEVSKQAPSPAASGAFFETIGLRTGTTTPRD
ncbi:MAG: RrF2 family transcriptional regulator [Galactobacter sp.]|uniref:RrF2 family transcriptional regulator n=1 Tax=Galactobacter sp. TaxID=2676125 RepID=UPI0025C30072|nr:Rrf2 family transcriptional regulator [Galactobacter sp.]